MDGYNADIQKNQIEKLHELFPEVVSEGKIDTPVSSYNPDWAVVFEDDERVYFVAETKSINDINDELLRGGERDRILAGQEHFKAIGVSYMAPVHTLQAALQRLRNDG